MTRLKTTHDSIYSSTPFIPLRLEYAKALADFGDRTGAIGQYEKALNFDDQLNGDEKKRLRADEIVNIRAKIFQLR